MVAGFMGGLFKWVVPALLDAPGWNSAESLDVLLPSFAVGFVVAIVVSLCDASGRERVQGAADELSQRSHQSTMKPR